ncbi:MAG: tetratricopeptide repeat protein [Bacteriovoracaceae bacterium]|jgi:TolA-binding protein|nr:tetratricopeptide repeat protein [Bacteriovoracaceae bacterium]
MNKFKLPLLLILLGLNLTSCKTQDEIQREQQVDSLSLQMVQGQQHSGENLIKIQELQEQIAKLQGSLDESTHGQKESLKVSIKHLEDRIVYIEESNKMLQENLESARAQIKDQRAFLDKVLKTLSKASTKKNKKIAKKKSKKKTGYNSAMELYKKKYYTKVRPIFIKMLKDKKIKGNKRARIYHNLGMIHYIKKKNEDALIYFSQLFTEYPKAIYNANGLLYMAKAFNRLKRKPESKQTLEELIKRYPKAKQVKEAKAILKKL